MKRACPPYQGWWDVPGGFLDPWEHPADGVVREVAEELGLRVRPRDLVGIFLDRYGDDGDYTLNVYYRVEVEGGDLEARDDAAHLGWFDPTSLPENIVKNGLEAIRAWRQMELSGTNALTALPMTRPRQRNAITGSDGQ